MRHAPPLHIRNAQVWDGDQTIQRDLYTANGRIVDQPANGAHVVDLDGYTLFPGLINAHDHLELNHYPRSKFRDVYDNAHQWGEDMNSRLDSEPYKSLRAYPLWDKVFIGGLKNLLCGATTVVHHGPPHKPMFRADFPVRVLKQYGWAHSLHFDTDDAVVRSYRSTPKNWPWFIHLAEGTDEIAAGEYKRLKALGCVGDNTVIVHGVGMTEEDITDAAPRVRGLVWCPTTNMYLLNAQPNIGYWRGSANDVAIGSDSRLTSSGDILDDAKYGRRQAGCDVDCITQAVTVRAATILRVVQAGHLKVGAYSDCTVGLSGKSSLRRSLINLVVFNGLPRIGAPDIMAKFPQVQTVAATLDGVEKSIHVDLARQIHRCQIKEPGLEVDALPKKPFYLF